MSQVIKDWRPDTARVKTMPSNGGTQCRIVEMPQAALLEPVMHRWIFPSQSLASSCTCDMCSWLSKAGSSPE